MKNLSPTHWHDYVKQTFSIEGHPCFVVQPLIAAPGKPWVWRTSFPEFHSEIDQELLRQGWHVGFIGVVDMLGCDDSLDLMDRFYETIRKDWGLAPKPALEAVSRGGLHGYRYADRRPERVACIYADTPVMDLKSWPLRSKDCEREVTAAIKHHGFGDEAGLLAYAGNPLDLLDAIAEAKIPLRHLVSLNDEVVPPEENTLEAQRRLQELGHEMELVTVESGTEESNGHHFPLPYVFESARFIARHSYVLPVGEEYFELRSGLANARAAFEGKAEARVAFVGGSITEMDGWRDELIRYFRERYPETTFDFVSAGIGSIGSNGHAFRLSRDVLSRGPVDLAFFEAAVNDSLVCAHHPVEVLRGTEGTIRQLRQANPSCDIVMMHFVMPAHMEDYRAGRVPATVAVHERVASHYDCSSLDLAREVTDRIDADEFSWEEDFINLHPSPYGQRVYANSMMRMLDTALASAVPPRAHELPASKLDPFSYENGRYGDLDVATVIRGFELDPAWVPTDGKNTREGFVDVPALVGEHPGDAFDYTFEGQGIGLFLAAGPDTGMMDVSVDGGETTRMDPFTIHSPNLHLPLVMILADELAPGSHTVRVRIADDQHPKSVGHAIRIIHPLVN